MSASKIPVSQPDPTPGTTASASAEARVAREAQVWVARLAGGSLDEAGMRAFEAWLFEGDHQAAFDRERAVWLDVGRLDPFEGLGPEFTSPSQRPPLRRRSRAFASMAAVGLVAAAALGAAIDPLTRLQADARAADSVITTILPDGSRAVLDSGAAIDVAYQPGQRRVRLLKGRAWFEVRPDAARPFLVQAGGLSARAVGTAYAVDRRAGGGLVTVTHGVVAVTGPGDARPALVPAGQGRAYERGQGRQQAANPNAAAWTEGRVVLEGLTVRQAIAEIDRYRPGRLVVLDAPADHRVNLALHLSQIDQGLAGLARTQGLTLTRLPGGMTLVTQSTDKVGLGG
jgi:transmembrane sensor